ncbi:putative Glycosyl transferase family 2 [Mesotoga infera]|uniref:Putative Glycosyl transferase family 2 n=1 Tax=Mesotoga infera TaxID=1236046 RepID=A0A7Z7PRP3_9BACT|nr:glycosyltransferase [Mesotoga infera]SSC13677.1 putative Glycosyl transferase family 2 [Mesotoga infera]
MISNSFPELSIVIPAYNAEKHLARSINSVLKQTSRNIELLLVDDGSTDETAARARELLRSADFPWRVYRQENGGVSNARNSGIRLSKGRFIHFLDSDDEIREEFVEKMLNEAQTNDSDIVVCGQEIVLNGRETPQAVFNCFPEDNRDDNFSNNLHLIAEVLFSRLPLGIGSIILRKEFLTECNLCFTPGCNHGEDREFIVKAFSKARRISSISDVMFRYIIVEGSLSHVANLRRFEDVATYFRLAKYLERELPDGRLVRIVRNYVIPTRITSTVEYLAFNGYDKKALRKISRNSSIRSSLRNFWFGSGAANSFKEWLRCRLLLISFDLFLLVMKLKKGKPACVKWPSLGT